MMENISKENTKHIKLECRVLSVNDSDLLGQFFANIISNGDDKMFHPHGFEQVDALTICNYKGKDSYYAIFAGENILGYGILRGWDAGYDVPSLGIYISENNRGLGLGKMLMYFLHCAARNYGSKKVKLKVYKNNKPAVGLYAALGYKLENFDDNQYLGVLEL